jgi:hypothetical protein
MLKKILRQNRKLKIVYPTFSLCARKISIVSASKKAIKIIKFISFAINYLKKSLDALSLLLTFTW